MADTTPTTADLKRKFNEVPPRPAAVAYVTRLEAELSPWLQEFAPMDTLEVAKRIQDLEAEVRMACQDRDGLERELGETQKLLGRLEWAGEQAGEFVCPECYAPCPQRTAAEKKLLPPREHEAGCALAASIGKDRG